MLSLQRDADRTLHTAAARVADAMVAQHAVTAGESRLLQKGLKPTGEDASMHKRDRLPGSPYLILKFDAVYCRSIHLVHDIPLRCLCGSSNGNKQDHYYQAA